MRLRLLPLLLLLAAVARPASAQSAVSKSTSTGTISKTWNACGGPTATSLMCAIVQVEVTGTSTLVRVRNVSGDPVLDHDGAATAGQWVLTTIGFEGIAAAAGTFTTGVGPSTGSWLERAAGAMPASWTRFDDKQFGGGVNLDFGIDNGNGIGNGIVSSCAPMGSLPGGSNRFWVTPVDHCGGYAIANQPANDGWFETTLTTAETWNPDGDDVSVYFKGQNGPGGGSYECLFGGAQRRGDCSDAQFSDGGMGPTSAVPEPGTFVLLGTGVVAILGVRYRRRRLP